jgi:hypothetical protein
MVVISIVTLGSLSALRIFFNKDSSNDAIYRVVTSYKTIKNRFHTLISSEQVILSSYQCVPATAPSSVDGIFQKALCDEEAYVNLTGKTKVTLSSSLTLNNGSGLCIYQVQLTFTPPSGNAITRLWMDQASC